MPNQTSSPFVKSTMKSSLRFLKPFLLIFILLVSNPISLEADTHTPGFSQLDGDPYRPRFHFSAPQNWLGGANEIIWLDGEYHLFYQHTPSVPTNDFGFWGHATSQDLVNWHYQPIALRPNAEGTVGPGSVVVDENNTAGFGEGALVAIYTHQTRAFPQISMAYSTDNGQSWTHFAENPFLITPVDVRNEGKLFQNPDLFWYEDRWVMLVPRGESIAVYHASDLINWEEVAVWAFDPEVLPLNWQGVELFELNGRTHLAISLFQGGPARGSTVQLWTGDFDGTLFVPDSDPQFVESGADFYLPKLVQNEPNGRFIWLGWMGNTLYSELTPESSWRGMLSIPRELSYDDNGRLIQTPIPELEQLREEVFRLEDSRIDDAFALPELGNDSYEIIMEIDLDESNADRFGFFVREGDEAVTRVGYIPEKDLGYTLEDHTIPNPSFEEGSLIGWTTIGDAFSNGDVSDVQHWDWGCCFNPDGRFHLWGYKNGGDNQTGELLSENFILGGTGEVDFLIGGGLNPDNLYISLVRAEDDVELFRAFNSFWEDSEALYRIYWDGSAHLGEEMYIRIVDNATGGWGHINVDGINIYHERNVMFVDRARSGEQFNTDFLTTHTAALSPTSEGLLKLHIFVDQSSIELFGNGGAEILSERFYPDEAGDLLNWFSKSGEVYFNQLEIYRLNTAVSQPISPPNIPENLPFDIENGDFETGDLTGWIANGDAFSPETVITDANCGRFCNLGDYGHEGAFHLAGYGADGNNGFLTGSLRSQIFQLSEDQLIQFLISGSNDTERLYVALVRASDGQIVRKATGDDTDTYRQIQWGNWDSSLINIPLYLEIVDQHAGKFGYLNVDHFEIFEAEGVVLQSGSLLAFDEGMGQLVNDSLLTDSQLPINYVFNEAIYIPNSDPLWRDGVVGNALLFDGYSTWIERPNDQTIQPYNQMTISAWVAPQSFEWGDRKLASAIVNQHDRFAKEGFMLGIYRHGTWAFEVGMGDKWFQLLADGENALPAHQWSFVTAVVDGNAGVMRLYLNGEQVDEQTFARTLAINPTTQPLMIGRHNDASIINGVFRANMFNGLMDDLTILDRAMTPEEVMETYTAVLDQHSGTLPIPDTAPRRSRYDGDPHRPQYHFLPPEHWMNEPHGLLHYDGQYHIFYQHNPQGPYWHQIHWGHAVSDDMVSWTDLPPALPPTANSVSPDGVWSGSAITGPDGIPALLFTAGNDSRQPNQAVGLAWPITAEKST